MATVDYRFSHLSYAHACLLIVCALGGWAARRRQLVDSLIMPTMLQAGEDADADDAVEVSTI